MAASAVIAKIQNSPHGIAKNNVVNDIISFIQWSTSDLHIVLAISSNEFAFKENVLSIDFPLEEQARLFEIDIE